MTWRLGVFLTKLLGVETFLILVRDSLGQRPEPLCFPAAAVLGTAEPELPHLQTVTTVSVAQTPGPQDEVT